MGQGLVKQNKFKTRFLVNLSSLATTPSLKMYFSDT